MKILLVSDTHGANIELISAYAEEMKADICIHAGDFGFYDKTSADAMSQRELYLLIKHSDLPEEEKSALLKGNAQDRKEAIGKHHLLGSFQDFLDDRMRFAWPLYATWGNHDDAEVVLRMMKAPVPNLRILHENVYCETEDFVILGTGGNCLPEKVFDQHHRGLPGARCRPTSELHQYCTLLKTAKRIPDGKRKILVTHVSPLVEPFVELVAWQIGADFTVSGHMGRKNGETGITDSSRLPVLRTAWNRLRELYPDAAEELMPFYPEERKQIVQHINLPDAKIGYGMLECDGDDVRWEIRGQDYSAQKEQELGEELWNFARTTFRFVTSEYSAMLPVADRIIAGELNADDEFYYTDRMLECLGYDKMSKLLHKCCESIMKRNPAFAVALLDKEHEMMEGSEAPLSDELRQKYDFHKARKNPCITPPASPDSNS
jgi:predicted phosphodiesterase